MATVSAWMRVIRVRFLLASVISVSVAFALSVRHDGTLDPFHAALTLGGVLALHASVDLLNDYWDYKRGIDTAAGAHADQRRDGRTARGAADPTVRISRRTPLSGPRRRRRRVLCNHTRDPHRADAGVCSCGHLLLLHQDSERGARRVFCGREGVHDRARLVLHTARLSGAGRRPCRGGGGLSVLACAVRGIVSGL